MNILPWRLLVVNVRCGARPPPSSSNPFDRGRDDIVTWFELRAYEASTLRNDLSAWVTTNNTQWFRALRGDRVSTQCLNKSRRFHHGHEIGVRLYSGTSMCFIVIGVPIKKVLFVPENQHFKALNNLIDAKIGDKTKNLIDQKNYSERKSVVGISSEPPTRFHLFSHAVSCLVKMAEEVELANPSLFNESTNR